MQYTGHLGLTFLLLLTAQAGLSRIAFGGKTNLLPKGGFESSKPDGGVDGWAIRRLSPSPQVSRSDHPSVTLDTSVHKQGKQSLKVKCVDPRDMVIAACPHVKVAAGRTYRVSCWVRNTGISFWVRQNLADENGRTLAARYKRLMGSSDPHEWRRIEARVPIQKGEALLGLSLFVGGDKPGVVWIDDIRIEPITADPESRVVFRMTPNDYTDDNIYHLPQGSPMVVFLTAQNEGGYKADNPRYIVELPEGIEILGGDYDSEPLGTPQHVLKNGERYVRYEHTLGVPGVVLKGPDFQRTAFGSVVILIRSNLPPEGKVYDAWIRFADARIECRPCLFRLKITRPLPEASAPKAFRTAAMTNTSMQFYGKPMELLATLYAKRGFNEVVIPRSLRAGSLNPTLHRRSPKPCMEAMKRQGLTVTMNEWRLVNGYRVRSLKAAKEMPDSVRLRRADGKIVRDAFDPAYMGRKEEWFVEAVHQMLDTAVDFGADNVWSNWEPYMYRMANGSFTERSIRDFAAFAEIPFEGLQAAGPKAIIKNHREKLMQFQSWQFGQAMKALNEIVREYSRRLGRRIEFIPCMSRTTFGDPEPGMRHEEYARCFQAKDYMPHFEVLSSWAYVWMDYRSFGSRRKRSLYDLGYRGPNADLNRTHRTTLETVERILEQIAFQRKRNRLDTIPYIHLTQNMQGGSWVVLPEAIGLQMLATFLAGADGVYLYYFPMGYDGRYWRSATRANALIATYEDFVRKGRRLKAGFALKAQTDLFRHEEYRENLTCRAFELDHRKLVAIANFDFLDEAVYELSCDGLEPGAYVLWSPDRRMHYSSGTGPALSPEDLRSVLLETPRMTADFLVLERVRPGADYGEAVLLQDVRKRAAGKVQALNRSFKKRLLGIAEAGQPILETPQAAP